jgi:N-acetylglucosaminyldiphosphoundecaprenol N-acetyl-beta-D-mannosaminyltransferase
MTAQPGKSTPPTAYRAPGPALRPARVTGLGRDDFDRDVWCILGVPVDNADIASAIEAIEAAVRDGRRLSFVTPNINFLVRALRDDRARRQILAADLSLADGAPLVAIARLLGAPITKRAAGADLFEALAARPNFPGRRMRAFFFGGRDGAAQAAHAALARASGGIEAAGWLNPGFGDVASMSSDAIIAEINAAEPDFVIVALGAAKGQDWIEANQKRLSAPVIAHLGAVIDFAAGTIRRAPRWLARAGLEWAWRIGQEPALWKRYFGDALGLAKILATRFAPQALSGRAEAGAVGAAEVERRAHDVVVRLSGRLSAAGLSPVRSAFREAAACGVPVVLDLGEVLSADRSFLGLVLMLEKNVVAGGLKIAAPSRRLRNLFRVNAMNYPDADEAGRIYTQGSGRMGRLAG